MPTEEKKKSKKIWLYLFYAALTVAILIFVLSMNDIGEIFGVLGSADVRYVLAALLFILVYLALYPLTLCFLARSKGVPTRFSDVYTIGMTEHFFNGVTPFATGGQPFQAYALSKKKTSLADATGLLIMNFLIFMMVTNTYALLSLIYARDFILSDGMGIVAIVGFSANFLVLICTVILGTSRHVRSWIVALMRLFSRIGFLRAFLEKRIEAFNEYTENTQAAFHTLWRDKKTFVLCYLTRFVTMFFYYAVTFFIIRALHLDIGFDRLFFVVLGSAFAVTTVVFVPTPGSSGGIEFAFSSIFAALALGAGTSVSYGGMLIWRLITYYFTIFVSMLFYFFFAWRTAREKRRAATEIILPEGETE
ncbi:MAG TPA: hypothetical protein DDY70_02145 [Clostridiales bacterium]|nr:hypothetical protein [Clostridiales bacterium]